MTSGVIWHVAFLDLTLRSRALAIGDWRSSPPAGIGPLLWQLEQNGPRIFDETSEPR
jgi:hypothetical protein